MTDSVLPTGLVGLSEEQQERLRARQQEEQGQGQATALQAIASFDVYRKIIHVLIAQFICDVVFSVFLYQKLAKGVDMSYLVLLSPLMTGSIISFLSSCYLLRYLATAATTSANERRSKVIPQITHFLNALSKIGFYVLLLQKLTEHPEYKWRAFVFIPFWVYLGMDSLIKLLFYRPLVKSKNSDINGRPIMREANISDVLKILVFEHIYWIALSWSIGKKLDGIDDESWVSCFSSKSLYTLIYLSF
jgi:hypothetical protein